MSSGSSVGRMGIAWECAFSLSEPESAQLPLSVALLSLGLSQGPVLALAVEAGNSGFASQIAVKISRDAIVDAAFEACVSEELNLLPADDLLTTAFKAANDSVYEYSHRMAAGGSFAAKAVAAIFDERQLSVAHLGASDSFLLRDGTLLSFFDRPAAQAAVPSEGLLARFIGANAKIAVDLSSLEVQAGDRIAICSRRLAQDKLETLARELGSAADAQEAAEAVRETCFGTPGAAGPEAFVCPLVFILFVRNES